MLNVRRVACCCSSFICMTSTAGILLPDISVQEYRDFAENLGRYRTGANMIPVYKNEGSLSGYLDFTMPDFGAVSTKGYATLISPSLITSVKHNKGYKTVTFGNGAQYAATYTLINRNNHSTQDFHVPRLNKVVTDAAPVSYVSNSDFLANYKTRYMWYTRVGAGKQTQVNEEETERITLAGAYQWKTGGTISKANVDNISSKSYLRYYNLGPADSDTTLLSIGAEGGDSGSPVFAWDDLDQQWKLVAIHVGYDQDAGIYRKRAAAGYIPGDFIASVQAANTSPDVTDSSGDGTIYWSDTAITQGNNVWHWAGLAEEYKRAAPSNATNDELDATKDLRFNGDGGEIVLTDAVNLGAGKLRFSDNYTLTSAAGANATWAGGGVEVDANKKVLWQVNGLSGDALHKIGDGTLHINATGINEGSLNVGAGKIILDQQADASGQKQAFSSVTLVSGRPTVVLADAAQVGTDKLYFGYRGGTLDLNGNDISFKKIKHTDNGAILVNNNSKAGANLTLTAYGDKDVTFNTWSSSGRGTVGSIYRYGNPYSKKTEYFELLTSKYGGYPTNQTSTHIWRYLGTDRAVAVDLALSKINQQVFRGFIGEIDGNKNNGELNVDIDIAGSGAKMALTGGMNLNGALNVHQGLVLLSGQPVAHAGGMVTMDEWWTSYFKAKQIAVGHDATFQVGEFAEVTADVVAGESSRVMFGYNNSAAEKERIWRCYAAFYSDTVNCSQPVHSEKAQSALAYSAVTGDVSLARDATLYLGRVMFQGNVTSADNSLITMDSSARWTLTGKSNTTTLNALRGAHLSMLPSGTWSAKQLEVDTLNATGMRLSLGVKPETAESDKLIVKDSATGGSNILDVSLMLNTAKPVSLQQDVVMIDAPVGTAHDYFTMPNIARGFTLYRPDYAVIDSNDRVLWVLQRNAAASADDADSSNSNTTPAPADDNDNSAPVADPDDSSGSTTPAPAPADDNDSSAPVADPADSSGSTTPAPTPADDNDSSAPVADSSSKDGDSAPATGGNPDASPGAAEEGGFNPDTWFTISDNKPLIRRTRALMASRQYIFSEALGAMNGRASLLRSSPDKHGEWASLEQGRGSWEGLNVTQQTLSIGWDTVVGQQMFGLYASHTQGKTKGNGRATHRLSGVGINYSWSSPAGWFIDAAGSYMYLAQTINFDPQLGIRGAEPHSDIVAASVKSGYEVKADGGTFSVTPYVGFSGGYLSGYGVNGEASQIALSSATPWAMTGGIELKKRILWGSKPDVTASAGLEYQYAPGKAGSGLVLSDSHSRREYAAWSDNRYRFHTGIEGKLGQNLSMNVKIKTSFGGYFKTDYSGMVGIACRF